VAALSHAFSGGPATLGPAHTSGVARVHTWSQTARGPQTPFDVACGTAGLLLLGWGSSKTAVFGVAVGGVGRSVGCER
jgi:hypothetical protein